VGGPELAASLHRRLAEVEARLLLQERRLEAPGGPAAHREDAERQAAGLRRERDELRALLAELRRGG
jgi:hypothetical protein